MIVNFFKNVLNTCIEHLASVKDEFLVVKYCKNTDLKNLPVCPICLDVNNDNSLYINCGNKHIYHADCIRPWLEMHYTCPMCKEYVDEETYDILDIEYDLEENISINPEKIKYSVSLQTRT